MNTHVPGLLPRVQGSPGPGDGLGGVVLSLARSLPGSGKTLMVNINVFSRSGVGQIFG